MGQTVALIGEPGEDGRAGRFDEARNRRQRQCRRRRSRPRLPRRAFPRGDQRRPRAGRRPRQGLAARAPDRTRARDRSRRCSPAPGPTAGSSPRTSSEARWRPPPAEAAAPAAAPHLRQRSSRCRSRASAGRSRAGSPRPAQVPVFQLTVSMDMTHANALVERSRELDPAVRVTVTDLLARVCASALMRHPDVNVQFTEEALLRFPSANIGIAVAAPHGLVVPVIHSVERLSLAEVAARRAELVERARAGCASARRSRGWHVHDLEPRHVRRRAVHGDPQPAAGRDPRGRRDRSTVPSRSPARSSSGR